MENQEPLKPLKKEKDYILPASILVAGLLVGGAVIYSTGIKNSPAPQTGTLEQNLGALTALEVGDDVILGSPDAKVTLIEFGDYQCPFCARFFLDAEAKLRSEYIKTGKVRMVYKDFAFLGPESTAAAQAAECAKDQSKYWEYHDLLFKTEIADGRENNGNLSSAKLKSLASELGLKRDQFDSCFDSEKYKSEVANDYAEAQAAGVRATPTIFINGQKFEGALPYSVFKDAIDKALAR